jgi:hypothetical protein
VTASLPTITKRIKALKSCLARGKFPGTAIIGRTRDRLTNSILAFIENKKEFIPELDDVGDGTAGEEEFSDETLLYNRRRAVEVLLIPYVGFTLTAELERKLCITVVGQYDLLRKGEQISGWAGDQPVETLLFVHEVKRVPARGRQYYVELEAYFGVPAGCRWKSRLTGGRLQMLIRETGVAVLRKYRDEDFSGLWLIAEIQYINSRLIFHEARVGYSQQKYNRTLMNRRQDVCTGPCQYMNGKPCAPCPVSRAQCPRARSRTPFELEGQCKNGHIGLKQETADEYCFSCLLKGTFQDEEHHRTSRS